MTGKLGMFSPEISRDTVERLFDAAAVYGFEAMQFDFLSVCGEELPRRVDREIIGRIKRASSASGVEICAVNGTFNMISPDKGEVEDGVERFRAVAAAAAELGSPLVTLCTGTRCKESMWRPHPDNETASAWDDMLETCRRLCDIAAYNGVLLGVETEASNVVNTAEKALRLVEGSGLKGLKIVFDPANLFHVGDARPERAEGIVEHAFSLLKDHIALAHGKDIRAGGGISFTSAGRGIVPYETVFRLLDGIGYDGPVVLHGIHDESEFAYSTQFIKRLMK